MQGFESTTPATSRPYTVVRRLWPAGADAEGAAGVREGERTPAAGDGENRRRLRPSTTVSAVLFLSTDRVISLVLVTAWRRVGPTRTAEESGDREPGREGEDPALARRILRPPRWAPEETPTTGPPTCRGSADRPRRLSADRLRDQTTGSSSAPRPSSRPSSATAALVVRKRTTPSRGARISSPTSP